ncbi:hypothetical protein BJX68DRAFT_271980 [Aspergillus pseudodeflectus]|uniref:Uncharacterized protein n=1 Tax=Aspergillus pseudodeflectus TaxID=176178 RepID=A0ABR4JJN0_9EURO
MSSRDASQNPVRPSIRVFPYPDGAFSAPRCRLEDNEPRRYRPPENGAQIEQLEEPNRTRPRSCALMMKDSDIQSRVYRLAVSTVLLLANFAIYLSFVVIRVFRGAWIYIVLIAILLCLGVIWCHALIRFIMGIYHFPNNGATNRTLLPLDMAEAASYAQPNQPIHVIMAGDDSEERLSENHGAIGAQITVPPPAYGLWQSSVRLNPDLLFWQRVDNPSSVRSAAREVDGVAPKTEETLPPSYLSNEGVNNVGGAKP